MIGRLSLFLFKNNFLMNFIKVSILIVCCFISDSLFAQTPAAIEADLLKSFKKIDYWQEHQQDNNYTGTDSLIKSNKIFEEKLKFYTSKNPFTLTYPFN